MSVSLTPVPAPRQSGEPADPSEPAKPAATVTGTSWPWDSPFAWAFPPERRKRRRWRIALKRQPRGYDTGYADGRWFAVSLSGGPLLEAATEEELHALIAAARRLR